MEYRAIRAEDEERWQETVAYSFRLNQEQIGFWSERGGQDETRRAVFDEQGQMRAVLDLVPYACQIDGTAVGLGGLALVASLPENRRGGYTQRLLVDTIREMKERDMPLSALYPFKQSFYRRYGWEVACVWLAHTIPTEALAAYRRQGGVVRRYLPGTADYRQLSAIYAPWAGTKRGYFQRPDDPWYWAHWVCQAHSPDRQFHTAIWQPSASAAPEGYLIYGFDEVEGRRRLLVRELVALSAQAESGLWGFVAQHDSQVKQVFFRTLRDYPLWHLLENTHDVKSELMGGWMLRLVDLPAAFARRNWPPTAKGSLVIGVSDDHAPWNQGTWRITWEAGRATVAPAPQDTAALTASVQTWAQLYAAFVRPEQAAASGRLWVHDRSALPLLQQALTGDGFCFYEAF